MGCITYCVKDPNIGWMTHLGWMTFNIGWSFQWNTLNVGWGTQFGRKDPQRRVWDPAHQLKDNLYMGGIPFIWEKGPSTFDFWLLVDDPQYGLNGHYKVPDWPSARDKCVSYGLNDRYRQDDPLWYVLNDSTLAKWPSIWVGWRLTSAERSSLWAGMTLHTNWMTICIGRITPWSNDPLYLWVSWKLFQLKTKNVKYQCISIAFF